MLALIAMGPWCNRADAPKTQRAQDSIGVGLSIFIFLFFAHEAPPGEPRAGA
jgi:hypothetical protein